MGIQDYCAWADVLTVEAKECWVTRGSWQDRSEMSMEYISYDLPLLSFLDWTWGLVPCRAETGSTSFFRGKTAVFGWLMLLLTTVVGSIWFHILFFTVWLTAAIIPCCKGDPIMSSNGDLQDVGSWDSFWEVSILDRKGTQISLVEWAACCGIQPGS